MRQRISFALLIALLCTVSCQAQGLLSLFGGGSSSKKIRVKFVEGDREAKDEILLISIKGVIQEKGDDESMPFKMEKDIIENLKKDLEIARKRAAVKAVLIEINSPGGEVTASDIVYHQIKKMTRDTKKPVVALIGSMGASGAYYVACAADKILAHPTSIIGSIGVLMQSINLQKLVEKIGVKPITLKSEKTPMKDVLSPFKEMTTEEKAMLSAIIESIYDRFIEIVSESRNMKAPDVIKIADGGIYTSKKAMEIGLIDAIGYREDAMETANKLADIDSAALVKRVTRKSFSDLFSEMSEMSTFVPNFNAAFEKFLHSGNHMKIMFR